MAANLGCSMTGPASGGVLRVGSTGELAILVEQAGLEVAVTSGLPVPRVLAVNLTDDPPRLLMEIMPGSSAIPLERRPVRLRALGAAAATFHKVSVKEAASLPRRDRPIAGVDFDRLRDAAPAQDLFVRAERVRDDFRPVQGDGFVHGDLWQHNVMFEGDTITALIDWDYAGVGSAGVDLGSLRCDAAMCFDLAAADDILAGWQVEAGREADDVAYWDVIAALSTPPCHRLVRHRHQCPRETRSDERSP